MSSVTQGGVRHRGLNTEPRGGPFKGGILIQILVQAKHHAHVLVIAQLKERLCHTQDNGTI